MSDPSTVITEDLEAQVINTLCEIYDPEIPSVSIYDLGLIYEIRINPDRTVYIKMTLTAPNCPVAGTLPGQVEAEVRAMQDVEDALVELTFDPPYHLDMMSEAAKLTLGFL